MLAIIVTTAMLTAPAADGTSLGHHPVRLVVTSPEATATRGKEPVFRATRILGLQFDAVFLRRLAGQHRADFKVYTPKGQRYQVLTVPFTGDARAPRRPRRVAGYPRPVTEQPMKTMDSSAHHVSARLPVAGTWIVSSSMYGGWRVEVHLDGSSAPAAQARFTLTP